MSPGATTSTLAPRLDQALGDVGQLPLEYGDPVVVVTTRDGRVQEDLDPGLVGHRPAQLGQERQLASPAVAQVAAELVLLLDQHHRCPRLCRGQRGGDAGRAAAGDEHVRVGIALVVAAPGEFAETRPPAAKRCRTCS